MIREGFHHRYFGAVCLMLFTSIGKWASLGIHISLEPPCIDLHLLWWTISLTSHDHGEETVMSLYEDAGK